MATFTNVNVSFQSEMRGDWLTHWQLTPPLVNFTGLIFVSSGVVSHHQQRDVSKMTQDIELASSVFSVGHNYTGLAEAFDFNVFNEALGNHNDVRKATAWLAGGSSNPTSSWDLLVGRSWQRLASSDTEDFRLQLNVSVVKAVNMRMDGSFSPATVLFANQAALYEVELEKELASGSVIALEYVGSACPLRALFSCDAIPSQHNTSALLYWGYDQLSSYDAATLVFVRQPCSRVFFAILPREDCALLQFRVLLDENTKISNVLVGKGMETVVQVGSLTSAPRWYRVVGDWTAVRVRVACQSPSSSALIAISGAQGNLKNNNVTYKRMCSGVGSAMDLYFTSPNVLLEKSDWFFRVSASDLNTFGHSPPQLSNVTLTFSDGVLRDSADLSVSLLNCMYCAVPNMTYYRVIQASRSICFETLANQTAVGQVFVLSTDVITTRYANGQRSWPQAFRPPSSVPSRVCVFPPSSDSGDSFNVKVAFKFSPPSSPFATPTLSVLLSHPRVLKPLLADGKPRSLASVAGDSFVVSVKQPAGTYGGFLHLSFSPSCDAGNSFGQDAGGLQALADGLETAPIIFTSSAISSDTLVAWSPAVARQTWTVFAMRSSLPAAAPFNASCTITARLAHQARATLLGEPVEAQVTCIKDDLCFALAQLDLPDGPPLLATHVRIVDNSTTTVARIDGVFGGTPSGSSEFLGQLGSFGPGFVWPSNTGRQVVSATNSSSLLLPAVSVSGTSASRRAGVFIQLAGGRKNAPDALRVVFDRVAEQNLGRQSATNFSFPVASHQHQGSPVLMRFQSPSSMYRVAIMELSSRANASGLVYGGSSAGFVVSFGIVSMQTARTDAHTAMVQLPQINHYYSNSTGDVEFVVLAGEQVPPDTRVTVNFRPTMTLCDNILTCNGNGRCDRDGNCECLAGIGYAFDSDNLCKTKQATLDLYCAIGVLSLLVCLFAARRCVVARRRRLALGSTAQRRDGDSDSELDSLLLGGIAPQGAGRRGDLVFDSVCVRIGNKNLLSNVSFRLAPGSLTCILGPSGAGKSSIMRVLTGQLPVSDGSVRLNGTSVLHGARLGYVPQDDVLVAELSVHECLLHAARMSGARNPLALVNRVLHALDIDAVRDRLVGQPGASTLSGGQRKRVSIGVELVGRPSLLLCDEPTSGLDAAAALSLIRVLRERVCAAGTTVLCVLHQPRVETLAQIDQLIVVAAGAVRYRGGGEVAHLQQALPSLASASHINPADFVIDHVDEFAEPPPLNLAREESAKDGSRVCSGGGSFPVQLVWLTWRACLQAWRATSTLATHLALVVVAAVLLGLLYRSDSIFVGPPSALDILQCPYNLRAACAHSSNDPYAMQASLIALALGMVAAASSLSLFGSHIEKGVFARECVSGRRSRLAYFVAKCISEVPVAIASSCIFAALFSWLVLPSIDLLSLCLLCTGVFYSTSGISHLVGVTTAPPRSTLIVIVVVAVFSSMSGVSPRLPKLISSLGGPFLPALSYSRWACEAYYVNALQPYSSIYNTDIALDYFGYSRSSVEAATAATFIMGAAWRFLALIALLTKRI